MPDVPDPRLIDPVEVDPVAIGAAVETVKQLVEAADLERLVEGWFALQRTLKDLRQLDDVICNGIATLHPTSGRVDNPWGPLWQTNRAGKSPKTDWAATLDVAERHALYDEGGDARTDPAQAVAEFRRIVMEIAPLTPSTTPRAACDRYIDRKEVVDVSWEDRYTFSER